MNAPEPDPWLGELELARAARDAGNLMTPGASNAMQLYVAAVTASGGDETVAAEMNAVVDQVLGLAENAILAA